MALTWGEIKRWEATSLDTAESNLRATRRSMLDLADELETMGLPKNWTGDASVTSRSALKKVGQDLRDLVAEVSAAYTAVTDAADGVRGVEQAVDAVQEFARLSQLSISADGTVTDNGPKIDTGNEHDNQVELEERQGRVDECVARIEQALRKANDVDSDLLAVLAKIEFDSIHGGKDNLAAASRIGAVAGDLSLLEPPRGASPAENAAWWASLSPDERAEIIASHPRWIGNLDGVDVTSRDLANRNILDDRRAWVKSRLKDPDLTDREREDLEEEKRSIAAIDKILARAGVRQLAGLDFSKLRTQAIIVNGNLDTADNVGVFTPGMTSTVEGMGKYDRNMADLRQRMISALRRDNVDNPQVATVTWLGYQAPPAPPSLDVVSSRDAQNGGEDLANFFRGINASAVRDPNLTAIGHSYGSTTTGYALQERNTGVDQTVLFGSPGAATEDINDYRTRSGTTYYAETYDDPVADIGRFGSDPSELKGVRQLETGDATGVNGRRLDSSVGHSEYLVEGTTTQYNIAEIATGQPENAVRDDEGPGMFGELVDDGGDLYDELKDEATTTWNEEMDEWRRNYKKVKDLLS